MSASSKNSRSVNSPPQKTSYHRHYSISPESGGSTSSKPTTAQSRESQKIQSPPQYLRRDVSASSADIETTSGSLQLNSDVHLLRSESNNERRSSNTLDSLDTRHSAVGASGVSRKVKAHVPSACVNCKRKHLACETKRPCGRCVQTGKETTCVDVEHKKRGRPRLESVSSREADVGRQYPHLEICANRNGEAPVPQVGCRRSSKSYRELQSQPSGYYVDQRPRAYNPDQSFPQQIHATSGLPTSPINNYLSGSTPTVLLTPDFLVAEHNHAFADALSLSYQVKGHSLADLVIDSEREKIHRLHTALRAELLETSPLPYMHGHFDTSNDMPAIENLDLGHATSGFRPRSEYWTFRLPKGESRGFPITISLARTGAHFIVLTLVQSAIMLPPQHLSQPGRSQQLPSPSSSQGPRSPPLLDPRNDYVQGKFPYSIPSSSQRSSVPEARTLLMQPSLNVGLAQYQQRSAAARTSVLPYSISRGPAGSGNSQPHQVPDQDHLSHLHLPPIRTSGTGISEQPRSQHEGRPEHRHGKQSPSKGSPQSGRKKKRRRVEIGEMLH